MTNESEMKLFDEWSECQERNRYIELTMQLFPDVDRKKAEAMADELGYHAV